MTDWSYEAWPSRRGQGWFNDTQPGEFGDLDFHVDLGCGKVPKARIGIDRYPSQGVAIVADLDTKYGPLTLSTARLEGDVADTPNPATLTKKPGLPFADSSVESIISHHFFEHVGEGFIPLIDECWRILKPGALLYAITPLFPSTAAVQDPDHKRYFMGDETSCTWDAFCGDDEGGIYTESFSVPYTKARFKRVGLAASPPVPDVPMWAPADHRELRVALRAIKA